MVIFILDLNHGRRSGLYPRTQPLTTASIIDRSRDALLESEAGPFAGYVPYTHHAGDVLASLAGWKPQTLAVMHGSSYSGDGAQALGDLAAVMREVLGPK